MSKADFDIIHFKERLQENLSSEQIADTLDTLLFRALRPIVLHTDYLEQTLAELLPFIASNARRKFSNKSQPELIDTLFSVIVGTNKKAKLKKLRELRLERTVYFHCFNTLEHILDEYNSVVIEYVNTPISADSKALRYKHQQKLASIERNLGLHEGKSLHAVLSKALFWRGVTLDFKGMVMEKFVRLAHVNSAKAAAQTSLDIDKQDLFKDFILSISKAIDKYNPEKGALTSYIMWWFMDAKTPSNPHNTHEYGVSFHIPSAQRKKALADGTLTVSNLSSSIDSVTVGDVRDTNRDLLTKLIEDEDSTRSSNLAAKADVHKLAVLVHEIAYKLSPAEIAALRNTIPSANLVNR